tara:strand:- start:82 stop:399 length:318 start_codon:yes stop_codon:yes gene_type:complete
MVAIGLKTSLTSCKRIRRDSRSLKSHTHKRDRLSFSRSDEHVHFSSWRLFIYFVSESKQHIGFFAHSADNQNNIIAAASRSFDMVGYFSHAISIGNGGASEFLND